MHAGHGANLGPINVGTPDADQLQLHYQKQRTQWACTHEVACAKATLVIALVHPQQAFKGSPLKTTPSYSNQLILPDNSCRAQLPAFPCTLSSLAVFKLIGAHKTGCVV